MAASTTTTSYLSPMGAREAAIRRDARSSAGDAGALAAVESLTDKVYVSLRADLLSCRLTPGSRLNIAVLGKQLSVSPGAVREALSRLSAEGLVEIERNRGFRAAALSKSDVEQLAFARKGIDVLCLREAMANGDIDWEASVVAAAHRAARLLEALGRSREDDEAYLAAFTDFLNALFSAGRNRWLNRVRQHLSDQGERARAWFVPAAHPRLEFELYGPTFLDALLRRDVERAVAMLEAHHDAARKMVVEHGHEAAAATPRSAKAPRARHPVRT